MISETISHYRILQKLGAGGMGEVYLAEDTQLDRKVAIKFLPAESTADGQAKKRLVREARAAAKLDHPNICAIHEVGEEDGRGFIVMQYVEGETLAARLNRNPMPLRDAVAVAEQVASALAEAHARGIIHRDIKPQNIMLTTRGEVKVLDFGLAKVVREGLLIESSAETESLLTDPGLIVGTVPYMSPEQVREEMVDARSDIFSFGAMLYEMVSGHQPFSSESAAATFSSILTRDPPPLARYSREAPPELERIVAKALRKNREERYQTVKDMALDLKELKQRLEFESQVEHSMQPVLSGREVAATTRTDARPASVTGDVGKGFATSGTWRLAGQITRHKLAAAVALLVVIAAGIGYYLSARKIQTAIDSIAVLPFVNANSDPNAEYLADGIPESIINSLSQLPHLKVMSRNSSSAFKGRETDAQEMGQKLGVRAVLTGRVAQRGESLAISVELVDVRDNSQLWGQQYNRKLADVFAVQEEIAKEISETLRLKLTGAERQQVAKRPTENIKAFQYYMQGRAYAQRRTREDLLMAIRYFEKAIDEDRNYALAYAGLADAYINLGGRAYIAPLEGRRKAEEAARQAIALDENLAEAHVALGQTYIYFAPYNLSLGDREWRRAIELSPSLAMAHNFLGISLMEQGRLDESLAEFLKARELDPLSPLIALIVAHHYYLKRDYGRALELLRQANELGPAFVQTWEIEVYIQNGLFNEALAELEKAKRERKSDAILIYSTGMVYAAQGKQAEALQIIKELEEMSGASLRHAHYIARIYAALNEKELTLTWLERGLAAGTIAAFSKDEPVWDPIRSDPRFADLLRRMGIPQ